jgi:hypothetical protein
MQSLLINAIDCLAIFLFLYLLFVFRDHRRRGGLPYPPGPPPLPMIGNILDIPQDTPWTAYVDMSRKYGTHNIIDVTCSPLLKLTPAFQDDVICLRVFSEVVVVLNSLSALKDLLEKRGQIYSERPLLPIAEMYVLYHSYLPNGHANNPQFLGWIWIGPYS